MIEEGAIGDGATVLLCLCICFFIQLYSPFILAETTFSEQNERIQLNLSQREKAVFFLNKETLRNYKIFNKSQWDESVAELREFHIEFSTTYLREE